MHGWQRGKSRAKWVPPLAQASYLLMVSSLCAL